jgi:TRAP-type transport system periplasmic protein
MLVFAEAVKTRSKGRIQIDLYPSAKLGGDVAMIDALRAGTLDITCPDSSTLAKYVPELGAINYPFTFQKETEADAILDGVWGQGLLKKFPSKGLIGVSYWENGFRHLTNSKRPITNFRQNSTTGIRLRVMQNQMLLDSFNSMGFEATPMSFPLVYQALADKTVDAQENPLMTILTSKFYEVQNHLTLSKHVYSTFVFLVSKKTWDELSNQDKEVILLAEFDTRARQRAMNREMNDSALDQLKSKGMQVAQIDTKETDSVRRRLRDLLDRHNKDVGVMSVMSMYLHLSQLRSGQASTTSVKEAPTK